MVKCLAPRAGNTDESSVTPRVGLSIVSSVGMGTETRYHYGTGSRTTGTYRTEFRCHVKIGLADNRIRYSSFFRLSESLFCMI